MNEETPDEERTPVYLRCARDDHQWIVAWLPMPAGAFARLLKRATCPVCGQRDEVRMSFAPQTPQP